MNNMYEVTDRHGEARTILQLQKRIQELEKENLELKKQLKRKTTT